MNNESIGVLGTLRPERSVMDKRLQNEFDRTREMFTMRGGNEAIGVLGTLRPERSVMDRQMAKEYNPLGPQDPRSVKDRAMQEMFNPNTRENYCVDRLSTYNNPYNPLTPFVTNARLQ